MYGHGKLDLKFVHGRAENRDWKQQDSSKKAYTSEAKIAEKNTITTSFGEKGLLSCRHIYFGKKLLPQINNCHREVMENNKVTSP